MAKVTYDMDTGEVELNGVYIFGMYTKQDRIAEFVENQAVTIESLQDKLKRAYCREKGADSIIGLDCCSDYRDWLKGLMPKT